MTRMFSAICALLAAGAAPIVQAGSISDVGTNAYYGSNGSGDVIGASTYDISGAVITRVGSVLTITISTNFAGNAGIEGALATTPPAGEPAGRTGIAYGDVLLSDVWTPKVVAGDTHYLSDNATTGTKWKWGFSLNDRWSNTGGTFKLYTLNGTNAQNLNTSNDFINCTGCTYRQGQAVAVDKTATAYVTNTGGTTGTWTVDDPNNTITFRLDMTGTSLINLSGFAMHWGETCANDVIEGYTKVVPIPGTLPLAALGLGAMLFMRRRNAARASS